MVTDRVATACLLAVLGVRYPRFHLAFLLLIMLDIFRSVGDGPARAGGRLAALCSCFVWGS